MRHQMRDEQLAEKMPSAGCPNIFFEGSPNIISREKQASLVFAVAACSIALVDDGPYLSGQTQRRTNVKWDTEKNRMQSKWLTSATKNSLGLSRLCKWEHKYFMLAYDLPAHILFLRGALPARINMIM